jgi:acyl dehydratase
METIFTTLGEDRYFEDYVPGSMHEIGPFLIEQDELVYPLKHIDSEYLEIDSESGKNTGDGVILPIYLLRSWPMIRLFEDYFLSQYNNRSFQKISELCWNNQVHSGGELFLRLSVAEALRLHSKPDRGIVHSYIEVINQNRDVVMSMKILNVALCLPA